jgi:hypothetical protein
VTKLLNGSGNVSRNTPADIDELFAVRALLEPFRACCACEPAYCDSSVAVCGGFGRANED